MHAGLVLASAVVFLNGHPWHVRDASADHVVLGFYDAAEKGDCFENISSAQAFAADAVAHSTMPVPVRSAADVRRYFLAHPQLEPSIAFFGHGNAAGAYINRQLLTDRTIKLMSHHLRPGGTLALFCCDLAECDAARAYIRFLKPGQSILLHWGRIGSEYVYPPWHFTGGMRSDDASCDQLWMLCFTK